MKFTRDDHDNRVMSLEITPMVDVVFLLIIFFMVTARFAKETRAELDLPTERGEQQEVAEEAGVIINITADGEIIVNGQVREIEYLEAVVAEEIDRAAGQDSTAVRLTIRADRNGDTRAMNEVVEALQQMGVGTANVATEVPK